MAYTNSPLVTYTKISPNKTSPRKHIIDTISVHCYVGEVTAEEGCNGKRFVKYNPITGASCNYLIGYDGSKGLCVEEKDRSWCTSNKKNDHRAITIEVASETKHPYKVTNEALDALIDLITDICKRNGKTKMLWFGDKKKTLAYNPKPDEMVMTVHRWFKKKACPGQYLYDKHSYIAEEVNKKLGVQSSNISNDIPSTTSTYTVVKGDTLSKIGRKTGVAWKTIADLNGIKSPYTLRVGQVLKLANSSISSNSTQSIEKTKVTYISHCIGNDNWCSEITGYNMNNSNGYSGIIGKPIDKFAVKLSQGTITYVAHKRGGSWFGEVSGYSTTKSNAYAGATGKPIDAIAIKASGIVGTLKYRVHTKDDNKWWDWITGYSKTDSSKYAGVFGKEIDAIQIGIE